MPAPLSYTYSPAAVAACATALLNLIDGAATPGKITLYSDTDAVLGTITLTSPAGTVDGGTGQLSLAAAGDTTAVATATCTYGTITDGDDGVVVSVPVEAGSVPVAGKIVLSTTAIVVSATISFVSATLG